MILEFSIKYRRIKRESCDEESDDNDAMDIDEMISLLGSEVDAHDEDPVKKKDKKLVFLSRSVLEKVREKPMTTGTQVRFGFQLRAFL